LEGYAARLALILHLCRQAAKETDSEHVDEQSIEGAWGLISYFKSHAKRVYAQLRTSPQDKRALQVVAWLKTHDKQATARDLLRAGVAGLRTSSGAKKLLANLVDRGHGHLERKGRKESFILDLPDT